ncbi:MAG: type II secretion system protein [Aquabacterium sp.]
MTHRSGARHRARRAGRGYTYLWLLIVVAVSAAGMSVLLQSWQDNAWRERERESMARARQIADAIGRYRRATGNGAGPRDLEDLLEDRRTSPSVRHLRRPWVDPLTGRNDWVLLRDSEGGLLAVASRSDRPAAIRRGLDPAASAPRVADRISSPQATTGP